ncbi:hypothetical protein Tco_0092098 [Tanacetum coccineum]
MAFIQAVENVIENESHFSLEVVDQDLSSLAMFTKHFMGGSGGGVGSSSGVGEGKEEFMGGIGGGSFAIRSMVAKDGLGGDGFVVEGGRSPSTSSKDGEDGGVANKSSMGSRLVVTGEFLLEIVVERLSEKLVELPMCSPMVERMVDREEMRKASTELRILQRQDVANASSREWGNSWDEEQSLFLAGGLDNAIDEDVDEQPVQDLALNVDNVFQADDCDAYDSDVDDAPTAQTLFMANLSSADPVYDEAGPSYDSDVLSEVQAHDHYQDAVCDHHEEHEMHDDVRPNHVVDSHADYTSDSNMTSYDQYVKDNAVPVVQNNASMVPNDAYVMIDNDLHDSDVRSVSHTPRNTVANNLLNAELPTYKEQVELYERRARFELTEREQKIDEQLRIVICDRNIKEENLKKELHSIKLQLASTIQHNKLMVDEVTSLKKDFNQKENKFLEEFLDLKALKDKVEDKLFKQGQSIQTVHMMCKPRSFYDEVNKVAIGYKNPLCLHRARQVQPALYSGHVIVTPNHAPAVVRDCEETLEQSEISRKKMHDKMKAKACVDNKVNFTPPNYSKENFLATFSPQKQLTPEQLFWSQDIVKMKAEALKELNTRPIKAR